MCRTLRYVGPFGVLSGRSMREVDEWLASAWCVCALCAVCLWRCDLAACQGHRCARVGQVTDGLARVSSRLLTYVRSRSALFTCGGDRSSGAVQ